MPKPLKPRALRPGDAIRAIAPASPFDTTKFEKGIAELERLGYTVLQDPRLEARDGYFAGSADLRFTELLSAIREEETRAIFCARGGYGSTYLLDDLLEKAGSSGDKLRPKILLGYSDVTSLQVFFWQKCGWVTFYGPMLAAGFDEGAGAAGGYDRVSFEQALTEANRWSVELAGETLARGEAEGVLLGGCLTLLISTLGTPWEFDARDSILFLEDRAMKPWQVDRALMHLKQAGKLEGVRGFVFGDFPECDPPPGSASVRDVIARIIGEFGAPLVWNAPIGHTERPMLTLPIGVRAKLHADSSPRLENLEPACVKE